MQMRCFEKAVTRFLLCYAFNKLLFEGAISYNALAKVNNIFVIFFPIKKVMSNRTNQGYLQKYKHIPYHKGDKTFIWPYAII